MILTSFADLIALLDQEGVPHQDDAPAGRVILPTQAQGMVGEMLILWEPRSAIIQCIHPLPLAVPPERLSAAESAITRINHALVLPGFGLSHDNGGIYFRLSVPRREDGSLSSGELQRLISTTINTARDFYAPLSEVIQNNKNPESVLSEAALRHRDGGGLPS